MRSVYKDFVLLLQEDRLLTNNERKKKVSMDAGCTLHILLIITDKDYSAQD